MRHLFALAALVLPAMAAHAADAPSQLVASPVQSDLRPVFASIRQGNWSDAAARIDAIGEPALRNAARAELYLAKGSPLVGLDQLTALLTAAPDLPQAAQLARLAETRGATDLPWLAEPQSLYPAATQPRRARARATTGDPVAAALESEVQPLIVADQPHAAEALLATREYALTPEARTEYQQRIAWSHYLTGNDTAARTLAEKARAGTGEWALHGAWVSGLANWRLNDCNAAADAFAAVASRAGDYELAAAGHFWAARADMACNRPERVQMRLRSAARFDETFYGLLAASRLAIAPQPRPLVASPATAVSARPNVRVAIALAGAGENALADGFIRHQARIAPGDHAALLALARDLSLPTTQLWLAHNAPRGASVPVAARYPAPNWRPAKGWRVDRSLVFAHALQESNFRTAVVSPAGATGLMQVRPGTAGDVARWRGDYFHAGQLTDPAHNIEYGQSYIEYLRDYHGTGGLLPKVIAAYNAGPAPIAEWNGKIRDRGDPLLWIESMPYWETRGYVPIVLRNYWIYEQQAGAKSASREALAQGLWPRFPGLPGATAVRLQPSTITASIE